MNPPPNRRLGRDGVHEQCRIEAVDERVAVHISEVDVATPNADGSNSLRLC